MAECRTEKEGDSNMNDQTAKADAGKPDLTLVPRQIIWDIAEVREYGNRKYGDPENWKDVELQRYRAAAFRHFLAYLDEPAGVDAESGIKHYKHLVCNLAFICEMEKLNSEALDDVHQPLHKQTYRMMSDECCGSCRYSNVCQADGSLYCGCKKADEWCETVNWDHCCRDWKQEDE